MATDPTATPHRRWLVAAWVSGSLLVVAPTFGLLGTLLGMTSAFGKLKAEEGANPEALAGDISVALNTTIIGLAVGAIALVALIVSLTAYSKAKRSA